ncbi:phosphatidylserine decarboxylase family protein [Thermodesulfobacteriota bacterium]
MRNQNNLIAREGQLLVIVLLIIGIALCYFDYCIAAYLFLFFGAFTAYFFRNPTREIDADENSVVAPADGTIIKIEEQNNVDVLERDAVKISIFMSVFNVHINRVPISGTVHKVKYHKGKFINASFDKASTDNERNSMVIETKSGVHILVVQIAGLIARRIVFYPNIGDQLEKGMRYGLIRFGSRLDVYVPKGTEITANIGQKIKSGEVLGYLR